MTTREVADLLRIKERKVYDMAAAEEIPCTRATGKLLFSRDLIDSWLDRHSFGDLSRLTVPNTFAGSHDPLLEWAIRESRCGLAMLFDGSLDGLDCLQSNRAGATGLHLFSAPDGEWNVPLVEHRFAGKPVVLVEWAVRERGLVSSERAPVKVLSQLSRCRVAGRQPEAGCQQLLEQLLAVEAIPAESINYTRIARSEVDAVLAVVEGVADCTLGLASLAAQYQQAFEPLVDERFDLLVDRKFWFEPPMQRFLEFCRSSRFAEQVAEWPGYTLQQPGRVRFNG